MMEMRWSLQELYTSFEDEKFLKDIDKCSLSVEKLRSFVDTAVEDSKDQYRRLEEYIALLGSFRDSFNGLHAFAQLTLSVNTKSTEALKYVELLEKQLAELAEPTAKFEKWIGRIKDLDSVINSSEILKAHAFFIREAAKKSRYLLSDKEETVIARMKNTGSSAWSKLQERITSNLLVDINLEGEDRKLPLSVIRNMAYEKDSIKRKKAYEAEIKAYSRIEDTSAACISGIKGEVITISSMRGYKSPLEETIINSRMDFECLKSMFEAIEESLPIFHKYLRKKGEVLGHSDGLPFYDLFAPMGDSDMKFTYKEAEEFIVKNFRTFSLPLADYARKAFESRWIDAEPREGKVGGAFCENLHSIGESRIMSNFGGTFSDVVTLAHELGHGYHGERLKNESALNSDYPMPIAETASTFCETIVKKAALKTADSSEALTILESEISDCTQVIVDIYSRFLFESEVFKRRVNGSTAAEELNTIMLDAQRRAYGDGLDPNYLHPYMWVCKPHYYFADSNFYNFPYAFGLLLAKGLYSEYLKKGEAFAYEYDKLLTATGKNNIYDITAMAHIDIHSVNFWRSSLKIIESDIDIFMAMVQKII
jgi:pepF/M3 family oligoendopeptidase